MNSQVVEPLPDKEKPRKNPILCRLGFHDWQNISTQIGVYVSWSFQRCRRCPHSRSVTKLVM